MQGQCHTVENYSHVDFHIHQVARKCTLHFYNHSALCMSNAILTFYQECCLFFENFEHVNEHIFEYFDSD